MGVQLVYPSNLADRLQAHLDRGPDEQLAFLLATWAGDTATVTDLRLVEDSSFDMQTPWHLSLSDEELTAAIQWAHGGDATLVEAHVHRNGDPAAFSPSDWSGLDAFVPHAWWRLRHRPYIALVFGETTFDGLVWRESPSDPEAIVSLQVEGGSGRVATGNSIKRWARP